MPRDISSTMQTALAENLLYPAIFVAMHFVSGAAYIWSGVGSISWNGHTWLGVGTLGTITVIEEGATVEARGIELGLSGINSAMLADALQEMRLGLPVLVYLGLFDTSSPISLLPDPIKAWAGRMDQPTIEVGGETAKISIKCENRMIDMNVAVDRRLTLEDAQMDNPGDLGLQFVQGIQERQILWGRTTTQ